MVVALALLLSLFTFLVQYVHPFGRPWPALSNCPTSRYFPVLRLDPFVVDSGDDQSCDSEPLTAVVSPAERGDAHPRLRSDVVAHSAGVAGLLLQAGLLGGVVLLAVGRWSCSLPRGTFTIIFTSNAILMAFMRDQSVLIPGAALAGLATDLLLHLLKPSVMRPAALRWFAGAVPAVHCALYFLNVYVAKDLWWSVHMWAGSIVLAGAVGWLLSYLLLPPISARAPAEQAW